MPLINCPGCGKEISNDAVACPNCGKPSPKNQAKNFFSSCGTIGCGGMLLIALGIVLVIAAIIIIWAGLKGYGTMTP